MKIRVKLFATLRKVVGNKELTVNLSEPNIISHLMKEIGIPEDEKVIVLVNGVNQREDYELKEGDVVSIFPVVAGG